MKYRLITIIALALTGQLVNAADITDTYSAGDTLTATKMDNIKTAVNSKQDRVIQTCPVDQSIRVINADGTVSCEVDTDTNTTYTAGSGISISGTTISARVGADLTNPAFTGIAQGSTTVTQVASVAVSAPSAGFILVTHAGTALTFGEPNTIALGIGDTSTAMDTTISVGSLDTVTTNRRYYGYTNQQLYTVPAAGVYTYYGLAQKNTTFNAGSINVDPSAMSAIFIPNKY